MKKAFRLLPLDILVFVLAAASIVAVSLLIAKERGGTAFVHVTSPQGEWIEPLSADLELEIPGPLGNTLVHIEDGHVAIEDSPCKNKLCIAMGAISSANQWIACLPNGVFVRVEGRQEEGGIDAGSF